MSDAALAPIITIAFLLALALWVPLLHLCVSFRRYLRRRRTIRTLERMERSARTEILLRAA